MLSSHIASENMNLSLVELARKDTAELLKLRLTQLDKPRILNDLLSEVAFHRPFVQKY